jgi:hypothetical protein
MKICDHVKKENNGTVTASAIAVELCDGWKCKTKLKIGL